MTDIDDLIAHLRERRIDRGLTQRQVSVALGHATATVSTYEKGHKVPTMTTALRWADLLDVDMHISFTDREVGDAMA